MCDSKLYEVISIIDQYIKEHKFTSECIDELNNIRFEPDEFISNQFNKYKSTYYIKKHIIDNKDNILYVKVQYKYTERTYSMNDKSYEDIYEGINSCKYMFFPDKFEHIAEIIQMLQDVLNPVNINEELISELYGILSIQNILYD